MATVPQGRRRPTGATGPPRARPQRVGPPSAGAAGPALSDLNGGYSSRDSLSAGYDGLVARQNLLWQGHDFRGMRRRLGGQTVHGQDLIDHGTRRAGPAPGRCVRGGERAGRPTRRECVSPVGAFARHLETIMLNRAARELNNDKVDQIQIGTMMRTAALLLRSSVTIRSAHDRPTPSLSLCFYSDALVSSLALECCVGEDDAAREYAGLIYISLCLPLPSTIIRIPSTPPQTPHS